jgi:tetratricopeptide (TPR) repeat protein
MSGASPTDSASDLASRPRESDAARLDRALVQASARAKLFGRKAEEQHFGRYVLGEVLGSGGAGMVWAAHDPKLDRKVALKLVRHAGEEHDARLLLEARALARLSHPNIVHVYDVGNERLGDESLLYIAMELLEGGTLRAWMKTPRRTDEVLAVLRAVGQGLAAAHDAGLVHRDFKPDNVLLGREGRPRVVDFGLVRHHGLDDEAVTTQPVIDAPARVITRTGAVMGTPAYMAPEQYERASVDAKSDQFAFCVTLFEALHGERPFRGDTISELAQRITSGQQSLPTRPRPLPRRLRRVLERGLAVDPAARFDSMHELLEQLEERRRNRVVLALGVAGVAAVGSYALSLRSQCTDGSEELAGLWDSEARASLRAAIVADGKDSAARVAESADAAGEAWAEAWRTSWRDTCEQAQQTERMKDLRAACLHTRRSELAAVVKVVHDANAQSTMRAAELLLGLRSPTICDRTEALEEAIEPPDPAIANEVEAQRAALTEAKTLDQSGDRSRAKEIALAVLTRARELGYRPLLAEAEAAMASLSSSLGDLDTAEAMATAAFQDALATDHVEQLAFAANHMVYLLAVQRRKPELAEPWLGHAAAATDRIHDDGTARARLLHREGQLRTRQNRLDEAADLMRRSCELGDESRGENSPESLQCWTNLGTVEEMRGRLDEALEIGERVLAMRVALFGPSHPDVAFSHNMLGSVMNRRGDRTASIEHFREAARVFEETSGPWHHELGVALYNLGNRLRESGDDPGAREVYQRALAIFEKTRGPDDQLVAMALNSIALTLQNEHRADEALPLYRRSAAILDGITTPGTEGGVVTHNNIGNILLERKDPRAAMAEYTRALSLAESLLKPDHPMRTNPLAGIGDAWVALGEPQRAIDPLRQCVELRVAIKHPETAKARYTLARALWSAGRRDEARTHLRILIDENADNAGAARQWLADDRMP